jgi:hypothetical protein
MMPLWNRRTADVTPPAANAGDEELLMLPRWSMVLAAMAFLSVQYLFHFVMPHHNHEMMPLRVLMGYSWGTLVASYILLIGYISRDVKRRGMSAGLWMLSSIVLPGGIGAVVYFLLRQPILSRCPNCRTQLTSHCHFCPQCQFQMAPVCGQCFRGVQITDVYCVQCGHDLAEDHTPARLRSFSK